MSWLVTDLEDSEPVLPDVRAYHIPCVPKHRWSAVSSTVALINHHGNGDNVR